MYGLKLSWIIPVIILFFLIVVIGVGIYQINSDRNPWDFGESDIPGSGWYFLNRE